MPSNMNDYLDQILFGKKPKQKILKETEINIKEILSEAPGDNTMPPPVMEPTQNQSTPAAPQDTNQSGQTDQIAPKDPIPPPPEDEDTKLAEIKKTIEKAKETLKNHQPKGDLVMEISLSLQNNDVGKLQIGADEYATITNLNIIFNKFGISFKNLPDSIKSFSLSTEEMVSQSYRHTVSLMVEMIDETTFGIQLFIDENGLRFDDIQSAIKEFDKQYGINILDAINKKVRE